MLESMPPWIAPVVKNLAAQDVPADSPFVSSTVLLEPIVTAHQIVKVDDFVGSVIEARHTSTEQKESVMVAGNTSAVASEERTERLLGGAAIDFVRGNQPEARFVPCLGLAEVLHVEDAVAQPPGASVR